MAPRTAQTPVILNIYDLSPANAYISVLGVGLFHSGIEIAGDEYSFASGAGIFAAPPKRAEGAVFRESIVLGTFAGSHTEAKQRALSLRSEFDGTSYNLFTKNCNTFAEALSQLLLGTSIPAYVNRAAYLGSFLSCLVPAAINNHAPVGDTTTTGGRLTGTNYTPFAGAGQSVGGGSSTNYGATTTTTPTTTLEDRREKLRQAALRRFESQQVES